MKYVSLFAVLVLLSGCTSHEYKWAFAQNMDNSFLANEYCRESLAQTIYDDNAKDKLTRQASSHVYVYKGNFETYRVYGFKQQSECETALTNMKSRQ